MDTVKQTTYMYPLPLAKISATEIICQSSYYPGHLCMLESTKHSINIQCLDSVIASVLFITHNKFFTFHIKKTFG